ncbi:hypothetical protein CORC01_09300 [Colletotrichum orchidophilum]|uniref:Uncharacterized protein n=1 Tax=Colletotrichum orchidophilum TaxID=1209926 RepID=A0A1G4B1Y1_9PEZI|nr:uncharacterized protein CORC01_09300 [Colletotrichum orchidophilum]OHE95428.1 hypothetical protein CORC01_09300 [Colletotrichum orchidophilum]
MRGLNRRDSQVLATGMERRWRAAEEHPWWGSKSHAAHARMSALAPHSLSLTAPSEQEEQDEQVRREVHAANENPSLSVAVDLCLT